MGAKVNKTVKTSRSNTSQKTAKKKKLDTNKPVKKNAAKKAIAKKAGKKSAPKVVTKKKKENRRGGNREKAVKAKQDIFLKSYVENRFNISKAIQDAGVSRRQFYNWKENKEFYERFIDVCEACGDSWEEALHRNIQSGDTLSIIFGLKTRFRKRGYGDKPMPSPEARSIIKRLMNEEITTKEAAYELYLIGEQIPDVLKIELEKTPPDVRPPELPPAMSDDELEEAYQRGLAKQQKEKEEFVPKRREEVQAIKNELKDVESFGPDAENKGIHGQEQ